MPLVFPPPLVPQSELVPPSASICILAGCFSARDAASWYCSLASSGGFAEVPRVMYHEVVEAPAPQSGREPDHGVSFTRVGPLGRIRRRALPRPRHAAHELLRLLAQDHRQGRSTRASVLRRASRAWFQLA